MKLERPRPMVLRVTAHAHEMAALVAAARWVAEGAEGELTAEAVTHLREVVATWDEELRRLAEREGAGDAD
ncbi:MAG: hypothetical protein ACQEXJ_15430 [Myxococcota bacterium]